MAYIHPSSEVRNSIFQLVERNGVRPTGRQLRLADATIARLAAGLPVSEGTILVAERRLKELQTT